MNKSTPDNFQSEQKPNSELQSIVSTSSHAIGNTNVGRSAGNEHWLYPFKNKIISVERNGNELSVKMWLKIDELKIDFNEQNLIELGIKTLSVDTPVETTYPDNFSPGMKHTGDMYVTIVVDIKKNVKLLEYKEW